MVFSQRSLRQSQTIIQLNTLFRWPQINLFEYFGFQTIENFLIIYKKVGKLKKKVSLFSLPILNSLNLRAKNLLFFDAQICSFIRIIWTFIPKKCLIFKTKKCSHFKNYFNFHEKNHFWVILIALCILLWLEILVFQFQEFRKIPQNQLRNFFVFFSNLKL